MTGNERVDYYAGRAAQARSFAKAARTPEARDIHLDLAHRYDQLLRYAHGNRPLLTVVQGGR